MKYIIQHRVETLAENYIDAISGNPNFTENNIKFSQWEFSIGSGSTENAWLAEAIISENNINKAYRKFINHLSKITPKVSFTSQCYIETLNQPFLIVKEGTKFGYFYDAYDLKPVGLMFRENQRTALKILLKSTISDSFFYYWNDAVNTPGYTPKLLLMFSAIEALAKLPNGKKDWDRIEKILGKKLKNELFKTNDEGLRDRLVHGEYFSEIDFNKNYFISIHKKIIAYFNNEIFKMELLETNVLHPQRHPFGNKAVASSFVKPKNPSIPLSLKNILQDLDKSKSRKLTEYEYLTDVLVEQY